MLPRTECTKYLVSYVKKHDLQKPENRRLIVPDDRLKTILNATPDEMKALTFFNLQKFLPVHYSAEPFPDSAAPSWFGNSFGPEERVMNRNCSYIVLL